MISKKKLMELYAAMVKCRVAAEFGTGNGVPAEVGSAPLAPIGEAILAGVVVDLQRGDTVLHPSLGPDPKRMKDSPIDRIFLALAKNPQPSSLNGSQKRSSKDDALKGVGKAASAGKEKKDSITVAFCDGVGANRATWKKNLRQASRKNLPLLFVCSEKSLHASHRKKIAETEALLHGVPVIVVDGHDVVAVYRVASESIARARQRRGPTIIATTEFLPSSSATSARARGAGSPSLAVMETHLKEQGLYRAQRRTGIERAFSRNLQSAIRTPKR